MSVLHNLPVLQTEVNVFIYPVFTINQAFCFRACMKNVINADEGK